MKTGDSERGRGFESHLLRQKSPSKMGFLFYNKKDTHRNLPRQEGGEGKRERPREPRLIHQKNLDFDWGKVGRKDKKILHFMWIVREKKKSPFFYFSAYKKQG